MKDQPFITIALDGHRREVPQDTSLAALVAELGHAANAVGTAVNGQFVARALRQERMLRPGDAVLLFQPIVGG